jgi:hypothetical protein
MDICQAVKQPRSEAAIRAEYERAFPEAAVCRADSAVENSGYVSRSAFTDSH